MRTPRLTALAAIIAAASGCGGESTGELAGASPSATTLTPSPEAHRSLVALRERFRVAPPVKGNVPVPVPVPDRVHEHEPAQENVIRSGIATAFAARGENLRPVLPADAKRRVLRSASVDLPLRANSMVRLQDDTTHVAVGFTLRDARDAPVQRALRLHQIRQERVARLERLGVGRLLRAEILSRALTFTPAERHTLPAAVA